MNDSGFCAYFDNSATTELCPEAKAAMHEAIEKYGNPSSLHSRGLEAHNFVMAARENISLALGLRNPRYGSVVFTSGGTEASNLAITGSVFSKERRESNLIITSDSEHPSVARTIDALALKGFEVMKLKTVGGVLDLDPLYSLKRKPLLISLMMVNNETGALYDVKTAFSLAKSLNPDVITHCDAVQGFLKCRFSPITIGADLVTVSAHKIHGPKGIGALYISPEITKARRLVNIMYGGGQENGLRSGTENTVGIAGFGAAAKVGFENLSNDIQIISALRDYAQEKLSALELKMNVPAQARAPHILNITLPSIKSETMLHFLSCKGICVSSGSACSARSAHPSESLLAFGLTPAQADSSLRISFCRNNTFAEIDALADALKEGIETLIRK